MTLKNFKQEDLQFFLDQGLWAGLLGKPRLMLCFHGSGLIQMFPSCGFFFLEGGHLAVKAFPSCAHLEGAEGGGVHFWLPPICLLIMPLPLTGTPSLLCGCPEIVLHLYSPDTIRWSWRCFPKWFSDQGSRGGRQGARFLAKT